jgi:alkylation response protein AidB-like acyl-CoA dehydrogenase
MRFTPEPEQLEFAASLRELLAKADTPSAVRAWSSGDVEPGRAVWAKLADAGVAGLTIDERFGGVGAAPVDLVLVFEELGRAAVPGPYVESVAVAPVLLAGDDRLAGIAAGELLVSVAMPPHVPLALDGSVADVVIAVEGDEVSEATATVPVESVDRARRLTEVQAHDRVGTADVAAAFDAGVLATAAQILGAGEALLERATAYATQRVQFGTPIGRFQAVKHQLADAMVGLDLARPLLFGAALAMADGSADRTRDVSAAKVACTDAAYRAARASLQVHGAIGYTAEYDLALWLTKVRALTSAWGTQAWHRGRVLAALESAR